MLRLEKKYDENIFGLLKQLGIDREKQGAGNGEIIKKVINIEDMDKVDSIQASSCFATNESELIKEIVAGDVSLYGHRKDYDMWLPFDYSQQKEIIIKQIIQVDKPIGIDGINFYNSYFVETNIELDKNLIIKLSENLELDLAKGKINFKTIGTLDTLMKDIDFIVALKKGKGLFINNEKFIDIYNVNIPKSMNEKMLLIGEINSAFKEIGIKCEKRFETFTSDNWSKVSVLLNLHHRKIKPNEEQGSAWYSWKWDEQVVPLLLNRTESGEIDIINWFTTQKYSLFINSEITCELPRFVIFKRDILEKLYDVPEKVWMDEIERINYSDKIIGEVSRFFVEILATYDITKNEIYYKVAEALIDKLLMISPEDDYILINKMQLIKRKGDLTKDNIAKLEEIEEKSQNQMTKCAVNILLENKRVAGKLIEAMQEEERNEFMRYPIYNLL